jgi:hypothetical protein
MRKVALIITTTLTLAALVRLSATPLEVGRPMPTGPIAAGASVDPFELMQEARGLPVQEVEDFSMVGDRSAGQ